MTKYSKDRMDRLNIRISPEFKRQILLAAAMQRQTLTQWVETTLKEAMKRQLEKTGRTDS